MSRYRSPRRLSHHSARHLYIDMSGGVPADEWMTIVALEVDAVRQLAAEHGIEITLHMTAFSHELVDDALPITVTASYPSESELTELVAAMPRAHGGTDFRVVWDRINTSRARENRDNVIISDLEWMAPPEEFAEHHPINLRYRMVAKTRPQWRDEMRRSLKRADIGPNFTIS